MNGSQVWIGLLVGLVPYQVERRQAGQRVRLTVRALFWSLEGRRSSARRWRWTLRVALIERVRNAAWAAVERLRR